MEPFGPDVDAHRHAELMAYLATGLRLERDGGAAWTLADFLPNAGPAALPDEVMLDRAMSAMTRVGWRRRPN